MLIAVFRAAATPYALMRAICHTRCFRHLMLFRRCYADVTALRQAYALLRCYLLLKIFSRCCCHFSPLRAAMLLRDTRYVAATTTATSHADAARRCSADALCRRCYFAADAMLRVLLIAALRYAIFAAFAYAALR